MDRHNIQPIVGIIPDSKDPNFAEPIHAAFWEETATRYQSKEWVIAQHGCHHLYQEHVKSEFTGLAHEAQKALINKGYEIMKQHSIIPTCFFPPSHHMDDTTIDVCRESGNYAFISDGKALYPYAYREMLFIPSLFDTPHAILPYGVYTFVFHPNTMRDEDFMRLERFIIQHRSKFMPINELITNIDASRTRNVADRFAGSAYRSLKAVRKMVDLKNKRVCK